MANGTIEKLIKNERDILDSYQKVKAEWDTLLSDFNWGSDEAVNELSRELPSFQLKIEQIVGDRWLGQEVMVVVGIGQFYSTKLGFHGKEDKVKITYDAILSSMCSVEVHGYARSIGRMYHVDEF